MAGVKRKKNDLWPDIGDALNQRYRRSEKSPRYFHRQRFDRTTFLQPATPYNEVFFGTKVYHIIIVGKPYDVEDSTFLESINESKEIIRRNFYKFQRYWVDIWIDAILAAQVAEEAPDDDLGDSMATVATFCQELCEEMSDCGFLYQGELTLESNPNADFFDAYIQDFWKQRQLPT